MARKPKATKDTEPATPVSMEEGDAPNPVTTTVVATTRKPAMAENTIIDLDMNLEDYEDYEILPDGPLPGECTQAEVRTSDKGTSYFYTMWKVDPKDFPIDYDKSNNPNGAILNYSRVMVPTPGDRRSITALKKFMAALGLDLKTNTIDCSQWVGKTAMLQIGHENYNGEDRNRIVSIENEDA